MTVSGLPQESAATTNGSVAGWSPSLISAQLGDPPVDVTLAEMTERQRAVVEDVIRQRLVVAAFGDEAPFLESWHSAERLSNAVVHAVDQLGHERTRSLTRVHALLDLLEIEQLHLPFDAQTRFYDAFLTDGRPWPDGELAGLATRLGFAKQEQV